MSCPKVCISLILSSKLSCPADDSWVPILSPKITINEESTLLCPDCMKRFKNKKTLKKHMKLVCNPKKDKPLVLRGLKRLEVFKGKTSVVPLSDKTNPMGGKEPILTYAGQQLHEPPIKNTPTLSSAGGELYELPTVNKSVLLTANKNTVISPKLHEHNQLTEASASNKPSTGRKPIKNENDSQDECVTCSKVFKHHRTLLTHIKLECGKVLSCSPCKKQFIYMKDLKKHMMYKCGEVWQCSTCKDVFKHKHHFIAHKRYECEKILQCPVCNKVFLQKSSLDRHLAVCSHNE